MARSVSKQMHHVYGLSQVEELHVSRLAWLVAWGSKSKNPLVNYLLDRNPKNFNPTHIT